MTNFPPPDYDSVGPSPWSGAYVAPTVPPTPSATPPVPPTPSRSRGKRALGVIAAIALVLAPAIIGYQVGQSNDSSTGPSAISQPSSNLPTTGSQPSGSNGSTNSSSGTGTAGTFDVDAITDKVDDSVININTSAPASSSRPRGSRSRTTT